MWNKIRIDIFFFIEKGGWGDFYVHCVASISNRKADTNYMKRFLMTFVEIPKQHNHR